MRGGGSRTRGARARTRRDLVARVFFQIRREEDERAIDGRREIATVSERGGMGGEAAGVPGGGRTLSSSDMARCGGLRSTRRPASWCEERRTRDREEATAIEGGGKFHRSMAPTKRAGERWSGAKTRCHNLN